MRAVENMTEQTKHPPVIFTERLCLRPLEEKDRDALFAIYGDAGTVRYVPEEQWTEKNREEAFNKRLAFSRKPDHFLYAVMLENTVIGTVSA